MPSASSPLPRRKPTIFPYNCSITAGVRCVSMTQKILFWPRILTADVLETDLETKQSILPRNQRATAVDVMI